MKAANRFKIAATAIILFCGIAPQANAAQWQGPVSVDQDVPETSSLSEARQLAMKRLQFIAAGQAGAIVIRTDRLEDNTLTEAVEMISATEVHLEVLKESTHLDHGHLMLSMNAMARVDLDKLQERVSYMRENRELKTSLNTLRRQYASIIDSKSPPNNLASIFGVYDTSVNQLLSQQEINLMASTNNEQVKSITNDILVNGFGAYLRDAKPRAIIESVEDAGNQWIVYFNVDLRASLDKLESRFSKYWETNANSHDYLKSSHFMVDFDSPTTKVLPRSLMDRVAKGIRKHTLVLQVDIGNQQARIPLSNTSGCDTWIDNQLCITTIRNDVDEHIITDHYRKNLFSMKIPKISGSSMNDIAIKTALMLD